MLIDLDSRDLIPLERDDGELAERLGQALSARGCRLVFSGTVLDEVIQPMRRRARRSAVMKLLNRLESLPHVWMRTTDLEAKEIERASACYQAGHDYESLDPFVASFVGLLDLPPAVGSHFRTQPLAAVVWELLYGERITAGYTSDLGKKYEELVTKDRALISEWTPDQYQAELRAAFAAKVGRTVRAWKLALSVDPALLAEHLWTHPGWAPASRLGFAAWHALVYDRADKTEPSDLADLQRLDAIPYVDVFTCDGSRHDLLRRLRTSPNYGLIGCAYWGRCVILRSLDEVFGYVEGRR